MTKVNTTPAPAGDRNASRPPRRIVGCYVAMMMFFAGFGCEAIASAGDGLLSAQGAAPAGHFSAAASPVADPPDESPNVIIFYADDLGWTDLGAYGSNFHETPNIDRLAAQGMRFTQFYAHPVCAPSRAMLLTGQYNPRYHKYKAGGGVPNPTVPERAGSDRSVSYPESLDHLPLRIETLAGVLQEAGYNTWHLGKWHLGDGEYDSEYQGFDLHIPKGFDGPGGKTGGYFAPWSPESINEQFHDLEAGDYITERLTRKAIDLIEESDSEPFFLYLAHYNVHAPYEARSTDVDHFEAKLEGAENAEDFTHTNPVYAGMLKALDESFGAIMATLEEHDLEENTIVIFASDNGARYATDDMKEFVAPEFVEGRDYGKLPVSSNEPLRGGKADIYEGGIRVPLIVRYPGAVPAGSISDEVVHTVDIYPTILELTAAEPADDQVIDGVSLVPVLTEDESLETRAVYGYYPKQGRGAWVRRGDYKLIRVFGEGPDRADLFELYNLAEDIGETNNLVREKPETAEDLRENLADWLDDTGALLPRPNPDYDPDAASADYGGKKRKKRKKKVPGRR